MIIFPLWNIWTELRWRTNFMILFIDSTFSDEVGYQISILNMYNVHCTYREIDIMLPFRLPNTNFCEHKTCNRKEIPTALVQAIAFVYRDKSTPHSFSAHISLLYPKYGQDLRQFVRIARFPCNIWLLDRCQVQIPNQMNWMWNERNQKKSV